MALSDDDAAITTGAAEGLPSMYLDTRHADNFLGLSFVCLFVCLCLFCFFFGGGGGLGVDEGVGKGEWGGWGE